MLVIIEAMDWLSVMKNMWAIVSCDIEEGVASEQATSTLLVRENISASNIEVCLPRPIVPHLISCPV